MFDGLKDKYLDKVIKILKSNKDSLFNRDKELFLYLCKIDPSFIQYAKMEAINTDVLDVVLSHKSCTIPFLIEMIKVNPEIARNKFVMEKLCKKDANFFRYCEGSGLTLECYLNAWNAYNCDEVPLHQILRSKVFDKSVSKREIKKFLEQDGNLLLQCRGVIDLDLLKIVFETTWDKPDISKIPEVFKNKKLMKYLCSKDGLYFMYAEHKDKELLEIAFNSERPLTFDRIPRDANFLLDYREFKDLFKQDVRFGKYIDLETVDDYALRTILKKYPVEIKINFIESCKDDSKMLELVLKYVSENDYTKEDLKELINFIPKNKDFINSYGYREYAKIICEKCNVEFEMFEYMIKNSIFLNESGILGLDIDLLDKRYYMLRDDNDYDKFFKLCVYRDIRDMIKLIGNPVKGENEIDYELGDKRLKLLDLVLKASISDQGDPTEVKEWIPYYSIILDYFSSNLEVIDGLVEDLDSLDNVLIERLTNHILGNHNFKIKTVEDLINYKRIKEEWLNSMLNSTYRMDLKDAVLERCFGISINTVKELEVYIEGVLLSPKSFPEEVVLFCRAIKDILEERDKTLLKNIVLNSDKHVSLDEKNIIYLKTELKNIYLREYNKTLFSVKDKETSHMLDGVKVYKAAGEEGDKSFALSIHVRGAFSYFYDTEEFVNNYINDWNKPEIINHGICCSYINQSFLGTASIKSVIFGFTDYEESSLLLAGPKDIFSDNKTFDVLGDEESKARFLMPCDMIDHTRDTFNEMVFERLVGMKKRQPSYVVLMCNNYEDVVNIDLNGDFNEGSFEYHVRETVKAAKEFGIPIVVVEREKIARKQSELITENLNALNRDKHLTRDSTKEYLHNIFTVFYNNYYGFSEVTLDPDYFAKFRLNNIVDNVNELLIRKMCDNPRECLLLLEELKIIYEKEHENRIGYYSYTLESMYKNMKFIEGKLLKALDNMEIGCAFNESLYYEEYAKDYYEYVHSKVKCSQINSEDLDIYVNDNLRCRLFVTMNEVDNGNYFSDVHIKRNFQNEALFSLVIAYNEGDFSSCDYEILLGSLRLKFGCLDENNYDEEELKIIKAVLKYKNSEYKTDSELQNIFNEYNISLDSKLFDKVKMMSTILKDSEELDKTRFGVSSKNFTNMDNLTYVTSNKLIKLSMQINTYYSYVDSKLIATSQDLFSEEDFSEIKGMSESNNNINKK